MHPAAIRAPKPTKNPDIANPTYDILKVRSFSNPKGERQLAFVVVSYLKEKKKIPPEISIPPK